MCLYCLPCCQMNIFFYYIFNLFFFFKKMVNRVHDRKRLVCKSMHQAAGAVGGPQTLAWPHLPEAL